MLAARAVRPHAPIALLVALVLGALPCVAGAHAKPRKRACDRTVDSAAGVRHAAQSRSGKTVCVRGYVGDLDLANVRPRAPVTIRPAPGGGELGEVDLQSAANIRLLAIRLESALVMGTPSTPAQNIALRGCAAGGRGPAARADVFALVDVRAYTDGLAVRNCDLGWTTSVGASGDKGFGVRLSVGGGRGGDIRNVTLRGNRLHHLACDALQISGPAHLVFDRNEIAYVTSDGTDLHADSIQILDLAGSANRFTNNYIHHTGFLEPGRIPPGGSAGQWIWHSYGSGGALVQNNLIVDNRNYAPAWSGVPSNVILRRNTIVHNGTAFGSNAPDMQWNPPGGTNRVADQNIIGSLGGGSGVTFTGNVFIDQGRRGPTDIRRKVSFDRNWRPRKLPAGHARAGYRKPSGVRW